MSTIQQFHSLVSTHGSDVIYHREGGKQDCPCLTPEGFRDPEWHDAHPLAQVCNEVGQLSAPVEFGIKGFVQPAQSTRATRLSTEFIWQMFGQIEADDHIGIFPCSWGGQNVDFADWSQHGDEWVQYAGSKFFITNSNLLPDPADGNPYHHWECGLRLLGEEPMMASVSALGSGQLR